MAIPPELIYENEDDFVQRFLIPLLQKLGFSVIANYHGSTEFGKDLIFAEVDRFGHIRFHALQAKYEGSISQAASHDLIRDCDEAFGNTFKHPHTGAEGRISSFYAVNAGSISDQAKQNYFNKLRPKYGDNAILLEARDLLVLDRWATGSQRERILDTLTGMLVEIEYNVKEVVTEVTKYLESIKMALNEAGQKGEIAAKMRMPLPANRFRTEATSSYLCRPFMPDKLNARQLLDYWHYATLVNKDWDRMGGLFENVRWTQSALDAVSMNLTIVVNHAVEAGKRIVGVITSLGQVSGDLTEVDNANQEQAEPSDK